MSMQSPPPPTPSASVPPPRKPARTPLRPVAILVLGILGLTVFMPLSVVAWIAGRAHERRCAREGIPPDPTAVLGRRLGLIGTVIVGAGAAIVLTVVVMAAVHR